MTEIQPDLTLFYNLETFVAEITFDSNQNRGQGFIYQIQITSDYEHQYFIGSITYIGTHSYINNIVCSGDFVTIRLPEGDINCLLQRSKFSSTLDYALVPGIYYLPITGGSKNFAFVKGTVALVVLENKERIMYVYFTK